MDERLKRINELSKQIVKHDDQTKKIIKNLLKKYPELKDYTFKTSKTSIQIGSLLRYISLDLSSYSEGIISSIKYHKHKENEQKIILSIIVTKSDKKWERVYPNKYHLFVNDKPESDTTKLIKKILKDKKYITNDDLFGDIEEFDAEQFMLEEAEKYYKNK